MNNEFIERPNLIRIAGGILYFGYLLYYVGRRYIEGYYKTLGISPHFLQLSVVDYIYEGAHPVQLLMAIAFLLLFISLIRFSYIEFQEESNKREDGSSMLSRLWNILKQRQKREALFSIGFFLYGVTVLVYLSMLWIFELPEVALAICTIVMILWTGYLGIVIGFDRVIMSFVKKSKVLTWLFIVSVIIILICIPHLGAYSWGVYNGTLVSAPNRIAQTFQNIELSAQQPTNNVLHWQVGTDGLYHTTEVLYLLLSNNKSLFIKPHEGDDIIVVPTEALVSFRLKKSD